MHRWARNILFYDKGTEFSGQFLSLLAYFLLFLTSLWPFVGKDHRWVDYVKSRKRVQAGNCKEVVPLEDCAFYLPYIQKVFTSD